MGVGGDRCGDRGRVKAPAVADGYRLLVGESGVKSVGDRVGLAPGDLVYHPSKVQNAQSWSSVPC